MFVKVDHLGSVRAVVQGIKDGSGNAQIASLTDYHEFGMSMQGRSFVGSTGYRFGYQGSEKDSEVNGSSYTTDFRRLDVRLGRWFSPDPITMPSMTPYSSMDNNPITLTDIMGLSTAPGESGPGGEYNSDGSSGDYTFDENGQNVEITPDIIEDYYSDANTTGDFDQYMYDNYFVGGGSNGINSAGLSIAFNSPANIAGQATLLQSVTTFGTFPDGSRVKVRISSVGISQEAKNGAGGNITTIDNDVINLGYFNTGEFLELMGIIKSMLGLAGPKIPTKKDADETVKVLDEVDKYVNDNKKPTPEVVTETDLNQKIEKVITPENNTLLDNVVESEHISGTTDSGGTEVQRITYENGKVKLVGLRINGNGNIEAREVNP